jgi:PAS domain S-box-containing protein
MVIMSKNKKQEFMRKLDFDPALFDEVETPIFVYHQPTWTVVWVNTSGLQKLGFDRGEISGRSLNDFFLPCTGEEGVLKDKQFLPGGKINLVSRSSKHIPVRVDTRPVGSAKDLQILTAHPIGKRSREQKDGQKKGGLDRSDLELRLGDNRYEMVFELMSDFVYSAKFFDDGSAEYDWTIGDYRQMTGYQVEEHLNNPRWMEGYIHAEDIEAVRDHFARLYAGEEDSLEYRVHHKNGEIRWLRHYSKPIWSERLNRNLYIQGAIQDITKRKAVEEKLKEHRDNLENMVLDRTNQLSYANAQLKQEILRRESAENVLREHARRLETLHAIDRAIQQSKSPRDIARAAVRHLDKVITCTRSNVVVYNFQDEAYEILASFDSCRSHPVYEESGTLEGLEWLLKMQNRGEIFKGSLTDQETVKGQPVKYLCQGDFQELICVPLIYRKSLVGSLNLVSSEEERIGSKEVMILKEVASSLCVAIQNARLFEEVLAGREQLRSLTEYLQTAREQERQEIAREIHDDLGQPLTALKMDLGWLSRRLPEGSEVLFERVQRMNEMIDDTIHLMHKIAMELRPVLLNDLGLEAAIEWHLQETQSRTKLEYDLVLPERVLPLREQVSLAFFRIFQEALTNVVRHAQASHVAVSLRNLGDRIKLTVQDDGIGISKDDLTATNSLGLMGMRERAIACGGKVAISGEENQGTIVEVVLPVEGADQ